MRVSKRMHRFFQVEIENDANWETREPSTLQTALSSAVQAPDDVLGDWSGADPTGLIEEIEELIARYGADAPLEDAYPAHPLEQLAECAE